MSASRPGRDRRLHPEPAGIPESTWDPEPRPPAEPPRGTLGPADCLPGPDGSCSICGDEGLVAEVLEVPYAGVARVRYEGRRGAGAPTEVATDLLEEVRPGDRLVVHLGFAIARVRGESYGPAPDRLGAGVDISGVDGAGTSPPDRRRGGVP